MEKYNVEGIKKPIECNGFKSKLEFIASKWLTAVLKLKILYEPQTFKTSKGNYTPDFYCKEINTYFECKPSVSFANIDLYKIFCEDYKTNLVVITPIGLQVFSYGAYGINNKLTVFDGEILFNKLNEYENDIMFFKCPLCKNLSFIVISGVYECCGGCERDESQYKLNILNDIELINFKKFYLENGGKLYE